MQKLTHTWQHWRYEYYLDVRWSDDCIWLSVQVRKGDLRPRPQDKYSGVRWQRAHRAGTSVRWPPGATYSAKSQAPGSTPFTMVQLIDQAPLERLETSLLEYTAKTRELRERFGPVMPIEYQTELLDTAQAVIDYWQNGGKDDVCYKARQQFKSAPVDFSGPNCDRSLGHSFIGLNADD